MENDIRVNGPSMLRKFRKNLEGKKLCTKLEARAPLYVLFFNTFFCLALKY